MNNFCFLNGKVLLQEEAKVSVLDIGLMRGYGIYDGLACVDGKPFRFADHWQRFVDGAHSLDLNIPITEDSCKKKIIEIVEKSGLGNRARPLTPERNASQHIATGRHSDGGRANIRMILTGGDTVNGIEYNFENPTFYITVEEWQPLNEEYYKSGAKLVTYPHLREMPDHKTINYIAGVKLQNWRKEEKAIEILYTYDGEILECATSNICVIKDERLITPAENVLKGITLKVVFEIAERLGIEVERRPVYYSELKEADEVFITSSFKDIVPIVKIDDFEVGDGRPGSITSNLMEEFAKILNI